MTDRPDTAIAKCLWAPGLIKCKPAHLQTDIWVICRPKSSRSQLWTSG